MKTYRKIVFVVLLLFIVVDLIAKHNHIITIIKKAKQQSISFFYTNFAQSYPTPPHWARQQR